MNAVVANVCRLTYILADILLSSEALFYVCLPAVAPASMLCSTALRHSRSAMEHSSRQVPRAELVVQQTTPRVLVALGAKAFWQNPLAGSAQRAS